VLYVISYDVVEDDRRKKLYELLKGYGRRVQYSVFECDLSAEEAETLEQRAAVEVDADTDSCRFYRFCERCRGEVRIVGKGEQYQEPEVIIV
jgi:CRISPR-associated protein Cas2